MPVALKSPVGDAVRAHVDGLEPRRWQHISPSQLGGCLRKHFLLLKGVLPTTPPSAAARTNFALGRLWEDFIAQALDSQELLVKHYQDGIDTPFMIPELMLGGTPDMLIDLDGELIVVDAKTVRSEWFQYRKRAGEEAWKQDNYAYVIQLGCYIMLLRASGLVVDRGLLAFASKDDGYVGLELAVELTPELEAEITQRCLLLKGYLEADQLPPCSCEGWRVGYCDFGDSTTRTKNKRGKEVNTACCSEALYEIA